MYHTIVRAKATAVFEALNRHDSGPVTSGLDTRVQHVMFGEHALGGTRHDVVTVKGWYDRLFDLFPDLSFDVGTVAVKGWPGRTTVFVEWKDSGLAQTYANQGVNVIELAWGKVRAIRIYCDSRRWRPYSPG